MFLLYAFSIQISGKFDQLDLDFTYNLIVHWFLDLWYRGLPNNSNITEPTLCQQRLQLVALVGY